MKIYSYKLLVIVVVHFVVFSVLGISRHWGYMTSINDLGCFDQAVWGVIHKGFLLNSLHSNPINWLGHHFNPILYFFVPLYYLIPTVNWFIFAQSAAIAFTALPIFLLAKYVTNCEKQALLWSIVYLFNPFVLNAGAWDFHPVSLAVPFIALAFLAIEQKRISLFIFVNSALLLCQEEFGLTVACFGLLYGIKNKEKYFSSAVFISGCVVFILVLTVIMPALSPTKQHIMFGEAGHPEINRYGWLGHSIKEIAGTLLFSPQFIFKKVIFTFQGLTYLKMLFLPVLFTALASPLFLLPMSADLLANMLSANQLPRSIYSYHSITLIPVLTIAAVYGCQKIYRYCSLLPEYKLANYSCIATITLGYLFAPLPLPFAANVWQPKQLLPQYDKREDNIKNLIGSNSVSVQANLGAHFSQREEIYLFPNKISESDYVILWLDSPTKKYDYLSSSADITIMGHHLQMYPSDYLSEIEKLLLSNKFKIAYWNDPWLVFKHTAKTQNDTRETLVLKKLDHLKK